MEKLRAARSDENVLVAVRQRARICLSSIHVSVWSALLGNMGSFGHGIPKQKHETEVSRLQVCEPASRAPLDHVYVLRSTFTLRSIVDSNDLRRSVHGISGARGQFFGVARDCMNVLNG